MSADALPSFSLADLYFAYFIYFLHGLTFLEDTQGVNVCAISTSRNLAVCITVSNFILLFLFYYFFVHISTFSTSSLVSIIVI